MKRSFEYYCNEAENIENYKAAKADNFKGWDCHHRLETHNSSGERRLVDITAEELIALGMYYNRPATELIFLRACEHTTLHMEGNQHHKGKHHSEEAKAKMSVIKKGRHLSEETKKRMSKTLRGRKHSEEWKNRISEAIKGRKLSDEWKAKLSEAHKGRHYFNNGKINVMRYECPEGFVPGRLV